jgi:hypothetical protein
LKRKWGRRDMYEKLLTRYIMFTSFCTTQFTKFQQDLITVFSRVRCLLNVWERQFCTFDFYEKCNVIMLNALKKSENRKHEQWRMKTPVCYGDRQKTSLFCSIDNTKTHWRNTLDQKNLLNRWLTKCLIDDPHKNTNAHITYFCEIRAISIFAVESM